MSVVEIVLIIIGAGIFLLGYLLPAGKKDVDEEVQLISEAEIRKLVDGETENVRERISDIVDETISYSIEKTERAMERVANEKIMAVNEYSDTVLEEINKNHKEVTFLYDMLNDKHETLMASIGQATQAADEIRQTVRDAQITADETSKKAKDAAEVADEALRRIRNAELSAREAQDAVQEAVESVMGAVEDTRTDLWAIHGARSYAPEVVEEAGSEIQPERRYERQHERQSGRRFERQPEGRYERQPEMQPERRYERQPETQPERWREINSDGQPQTRLERYPEPSGYTHGDIYGNTYTDAYENTAYENTYENREENAAENMTEQPEEYWEPVSEEHGIGQTAQPEDDFRPISPRRVEIIHEPEADYVAGEQDISTSEAFARLGIFGSRESGSAPGEPASASAPAPGDYAPVPASAPAFGDYAHVPMSAPAPVSGDYAHVPAYAQMHTPEEPREVDIRFAQGKNNERNSNERILELHKAGKSNMAIAKELGLGLGEVKLVIDLFEGV